MLLLSDCILKSVPTWWCSSRRSSPDINKQDRAWFKRYKRALSTRVPAWIDLIIIGGGFFDDRNTIPRNCKIYCWINKNLFFSSLHPPSSFLCIATRLLLELERRRWNTSDYFLKETKTVSPLYFIHSARVTKLIKYPLRVFNIHYLNSYIFEYNQISTQSIFLFLFFWKSVELFSQVEVARVLGSHNNESRWTHCCTYMQTVARNVSVKTTTLIH